MAFVWSNRGKQKFAENGHVCDKNCYMAMELTWTLLAAVYMTWRSIVSGKMDWV